MEKEKDEQDEGELGANMVCDMCFVDTGFGFGVVLASETIFIHASGVQGEMCSWSVRTRGHTEEKDKEKANQVVRQMRRAAALTAELAGIVREQGDRGLRPAAGRARRRVRNSTRCDGTALSRQPHAAAFTRRQHEPGQDTALDDEVLDFYVRAGLHGQDLVAQEARKREVAGAQERDQMRTGSACKTKSRR